jgi:hypothetical protein
MPESVPAHLSSTLPLELVSSERLSAHLSALSLERLKSEPQLVHLPLAL